MSSSMIAEVVLGVVAAAELFGDPSDVVLYDEELASISKAVESRRREFGTVRHCARLALGELGHPPVPLLRGDRGEPQWPAGIVGSMTHCAGYRAAAVARASDVDAIGIDAEPHLPLPNDLLKMIAFGDEKDHLAALSADDPSVCWDRLLFSCKEAVYKAWFPLARTWLGFEDAAVVIDPVARTFSTRLLVSGLTVRGQPRRRLSGRWLVRDDLILAAVTLPVRGPSGSEAS